MAAIKFSKQNIKPNPSEVDYWVDITSNPYGGRLKYFNGTDWVDLVNVDDSTVDLNGYYTKLQINQMLSDKASVSSVESKVDDDEIKDVIKNIDIKDIGNDGVQLVLFKYDNTNVAVTFPVASQTTSGIVTAESFKDFVKQHQLQQLYTEMYNKLSEIRTTYQKKLKAGTNIKIDENNTIHAVSDVSLDWEDIYNKPDFNAEFQAISNQVVSETNRAVNAENQLSSRIDDHVSVVEGKLDLKANSKDIYTKDQIDEKISGVYRIKGSRSFNDLPDVNRIGDVYNISNEFVLDGVTYPVGTNIVYTATGWDALSGIFDYTELEDSVQDIDTKIDEEIIRAKEKELKLDKKFDDYLPLSGGSLKGQLEIDVSSTNVLTVKTNTTNQPTIIFKGKAGTLSRLTTNGTNNSFFRTDAGWTTNYRIWDEGNDGEGSGLDADTLDGVHLNRLFLNNIWFNGSVNSCTLGLYLLGGNAADAAVNSGSLLSFVGAENRGGQFLFGADFKLYYRNLWDRFGDWKTIAYTDSDITGNSAGASILIGNELKENQDLNNLTDYSGIKFWKRIPDNIVNAPIFNSWQNSMLQIPLHGSSSKYAQLYFSSGNPLYYRSEHTADWKQIATTDYNGFYNLYGGSAIVENSDLNDFETPGTFYTVSDIISKTIKNQPSDNTASFTLVVSYPIKTSQYIKQVLISYAGAYQWVRHYNKATNYWDDWKRQTTDLSTYNAPTATKLAKSIKLWGNDFDGSSDISGQITLNNNTSLSAVDTNGKKSQILKLSASNNLVLGGSSAENGFDTYIHGNNIRIQCGSTHLDGIYVNDTGNVGIGTTNPQYKLDVLGAVNAQIFKGSQVKSDSSITISSQNDGIYFRYDSDDQKSIMHGGSFFGPTNASGGLIDLGRPESRMRSIYANNGNFKQGVTIANNTNYHVLDSSGSARGVVAMNGSDQLTFGYGSSVAGLNTLIFGKNISLFSGESNVRSVMVNSSNNVTIGNQDLASTNYKLYVNGSLNLTDSIYLSGSPYIRHKKGDYSIFGNSITETYLRGSAIKFQIDQTSNMIINSSGNVTLDSVDNAGASYKLFVSGDSCFKGNSFNYGNVVFISSDGTIQSRIAQGNSNIDLYIQTKHTTNGSNNGRMMMCGYNGDSLEKFSVKSYTTDINGTLSVDKQILSGDLVDWYGVSWSEDSSDPTCTRIGNMALHRSLPIQSAMKGYVIFNVKSQYGNPEDIIPLCDKWVEGSKYTSYTNDGYRSVADQSNNNIMVKIPEFWYIDDYEPSTKTHNLKISQTAKAGWCHHKEAYVGAYEGYSDNISYRSTRNATPTVSASRTTLRSLARANGYEDEYKWNIYTYEEHRAICHLFLVEYATRNSQAPVNTALTSDGFKQGGLGSGCTTDTVTVNGVTTYSFIPTGTTDSLGNGSGQVAYTFTNTDADGNETGTVTRYANRYRGIENPFGHIWKHVDDIVNIYNAEATYKTVYKCSKPEHFATYKNAKYKPLCSFPGGSKMQGWSKEIKATINCDFFTYSVGGGESTYWCDYNYDNDDTSEHCLLIGGGSGDGTPAGLFYTHLGGGASFSTIGIGSRLTYLPWVE